MLLSVNWLKVPSINLETNKLFEKREGVESTTSTQLLQDDSEYKHRFKRPEGFEILCRSDPSCPEDCDACCKLPYHKITGGLFRSITR